MNKTWFISSIIAGMLSAFVSFWLLQDWLISFLIFVLVFIIVFRLSPHRRYMSAFWATLSTLIVLNKYSIDIIGNILNIEFKIKSTEINNLVSVFLVVLCIVSLILDFFERNKTKGTLKSSKKTIIKNKGDSYYSESDMSINKETKK